MLVQLPFFIGIGFCFGLLQQRGVALLYIALRWGNGWRVFLAQMFFLGLATLAGLALIKALDGPGLGAGLQFAGLVVGWAGGRWFAQAPAERDKAVFVAAAGVFVAIGAFEYEYHSLGKLTDFSAGGVSLKFAERETVGERSVTHAVEYTGNEPFRGRARLTFAVGTLLNLPDYIDRDEQYAELFSGYEFASRSPTDIATLEGNLAVERQFEPMTRQYLAFFCAKIYPLAKLLSALHEIRKGEVSSITLNPSLIAEIRDAYESMLYPPMEERAPSKYPEAVLGPDGSQQFWGVDGFEPALHQTTDSVNRMVARISPSMNSRPPPMACSTHSETRLSLPTFGNSKEYTSEDAFSFVSYFAATAALAEFAIDNRERSLQLLDDILLNGSPIDRGDKAAKEKAEKVGAKSMPDSLAIPPERSQSFIHCQTLKDDNKPDKQGSLNRRRCEAAAMRLQIARRVVARVRLETLEDALIEQADNRDLTAIRISLLKRTIMDMETLVAMMGEAADFEKDAPKFDMQAFFGARVGVSGVGCAARVPPDEPARGLVARWMTSLTSYRSNALESAANRPDVVSANPSLVPILDQWARDVSGFNVDCVKPWLPENWLENLRAKLLVLAAEYWEAKGERFGLAAAAETRLAELGVTYSAQVAAICDARNEFQFASQLYKMPGGFAADEYNMSLDDRAGANSHPKIIAQMEEDYLRAKTALSHLPAAESEKACP